MWFKLISIVLAAALVALTGFVIGHVRSQAKHNEETAAAIQRLQKVSAGPRKVELFDLPEGTYEIVSSAQIYSYSYSKPDPADIVYGYEIRRISKGGGEGPSQSTDTYLIKERGNANGSAHPKGTMMDVKAGDISYYPPPSI